MAEDVSSRDGQISLSGSPRRGHPVRIRKPNPRIFGDEIDDPRLGGPSRPRKQSRPSMVQQPTLPKPGLTTPDKKAAQGIGVRLRNLLKLPKAHKWVCYEWFYSNIDLPLFEGENDFHICLQESFPQLRVKRLRRTEWCKVRRLMGKPRRCSAAFFAEERAVLQSRRDKIRMLQQRKPVDPNEIKDLPHEIPLHLVIGTKVTARLRSPQDGLFTGVIDALDTVYNTYRVTFDRPGLGTHSIPDYEVLSQEPQETMPLTSFVERRRPGMLSPPRYVPPYGSPALENDPLLGSSPLLSEGGTYGGYPVKFLVLITRLTKILSIKKDRVKELREMNKEAEMLRSQNKSLSMYFQQKYAAVVLELERLNKDLNEYLLGAQQFAHEIAPEQPLSPLIGPSTLKQRADQEAEALTMRTNIQSGRKMVRNERILDLVQKLTSILLQIRTFSESDVYSFKYQSLQESLSDIKDNLDPANISVFQNNVEIHVNHIQSGLSQMGNLSAFAASVSSMS